MIAVIGQICSGKSTFIKNFNKMHYKTFSCDEFFVQSYKKNGECYKQVIQKIGPFLANNEGLDKNKIKSWIEENKEHIGLLEKIIYPILYDELKTKKYDFVEIPNLTTTIRDFTKLFSGIICVSTSPQKRMKNIAFRNVDKRTIEQINKKNNPFLIKKALFGKLPIVDIYGNNFDAPEYFEDFLNYVKRYL